MPSLTPGACLSGIQQTFFTKDILTFRSRKSTSVANNIDEGSVFSKCPSKPRVRQHAQYQNVETEAAKWNSAIIKFIIHICSLCAATCQNVLCEKGNNRPSHLDIEMKNKE